MSNIDKQQIRADIAIRKSMPGFSVSPDHSLARLKAIQETQRSFDVEVVEALLDELEAKGRRIEEEIGRANREHHRGFMMACGHLKEHSNVHYADATEMEIAALRKRINELEAREVKLPERYEVDMCPTPSPDGEWYSREDVLSALVSAGLKVAAAVKGVAS